MHVVHRRNNLQGFPLSLFARFLLSECFDHNDFDFAKLREILRDDVKGFLGVHDNGCYQESDKLKKETFI